MILSRNDSQRATMIDRVRKFQRPNFSQRVGPGRGTSADQLAAAADLSMWTIRAFADMYCLSTLKDVVLMFLNENTDGIRCVYSTVKHIPKICQTNRLTDTYRYMQLNL